MLKGHICLPFVLFLWSACSADSSATSFGSSACFTCLAQSMNCARQLEDCHQDPGCASRLSCVAGCPLEPGGDAEAACEAACPAGSGSTSARLWSAFASCRATAEASACPTCGRSVAPTPLPYPLAQDCPSDLKGETPCMDCLLQNCCISLIEYYDSPNRVEDFEICYQGCRNLANQYQCELDCKLMYPQAVGASGAFDACASYNCIHTKKCPYVNSNYCGECMNRLCPLQVAKFMAEADCSFYLSCRDVSGCASLNDFQLQNECDLDCLRQYPKCIAPQDDLAACSPACDAVCAKS